MRKRGLVCEPTVFETGSFSTTSVPNGLRRMAFSSSPRKAHPRKSLTRLVLDARKAAPAIEKALRLRRTEPEGPHGVPPDVDPA
jgi:hypothetical protein